MQNFFRKNLKAKDINQIFIEEKETNLSLNESPYNPLKLLSDDDRVEIANFDINKYPREQQKKELKQEIISYCNSVIKEENILLGNGIDELLYFLFASISEPKSKVIINTPTYPDYKNYGESLSLDFYELPLNEIFQPQIKKLIQLSKKKETKLIILCTPNNPTGNLITSGDIYYLLENVKDTLILVDEAYFEYSNKTFVENLSNYPNLIITRSFSKGFHSSGLRFGYLLASPYIIQNLLKVKPVFNLSSLTIFIAKKILQNKEIMLSKIEELKQNRETLYNYLKKQPLITPYESYTNFILFRVEQPISHIDLYNFLLENNLSIRNVSNSNSLKNCLRVSISNEKEINRFKLLLSNYIERQQ